MPGILLHLQMNIADRHLLITFMLEYQHAVNDLQPGNIE